MRSPTATNPPKPTHTTAGQTRALGPANLLSLRSQDEPKSSITSAIGRAGGRCARASNKACGVRGAIRRGRRMMMMESPRSAAASGGARGLEGGSSWWWLCSTSPGRLCSTTTEEYFELLMKAETEAALPSFAACTTIHPQRNPCPYLLLLLPLTPS